MAGGGGHENGQQKVCTETCIIVYFTFTLWFSAEELVISNAWIIKGNYISPTANQPETKTLNLQKTK